MKMILPPSSHINLLLKVLQSGGPRTTPSGYPGGPVVPSGQLSPQHSTATSQIHLRNTSQQPSQLQTTPASLGYSTTGRMSVHQQNAPGAAGPSHQQGPVSFTRALEMTENLAKDAQVHEGHMPVGGSGDSNPQDNQKRDSVYDANNYEISV